MPALDNKKLVSELAQLLKPYHDENWSKLAGERRVTYIPFSEDEQKLSPEQKAKGEITLRKIAEKDQAVQALRSFAKEVQRQINLTVSAYPVTPDNLMAAYKQLEDEKGPEILQKVACKTPIIIQYGNDEDPKDLGIRATDSINVTGHGRKSDATISSGAEGSPDLNASDVVSRLVENLKNDERASLDPLLKNTIGTIKLDSCGSAGTFLAAFTEEAGKKNLDPDLVIHGYKLDFIQNTPLDFALDHLDKGTRLVSTDEAVKIRDQAWENSWLAEVIERQADQLNLGDLTLDDLKTKVDQEMDTIKEHQRSREDLDDMDPANIPDDARLDALRDLNSDVMKLQGADIEGLWPKKKNLAELDYDLENDLVEGDKNSTIDRQTALMGEIAKLEKKKQLRESKTCSQLATDLHADIVELNYSTTERGKESRTTLTVREVLEAKKSKEPAQDGLGNSKEIQASTAAKGLRNG